MRILLIGGGKVGSFLARELERAGHIVSVIEENAQRAQALTEQSRVLVFEGDGTDIALMKAADVDRSDWVLCVTGLDEVNLVACQLALSLGAKRVLARLNNPLNRPTFDALEIPVVAVTDLMAQVISREVEVPDLSRIALIGKGNISLCELEIPDGFPSTPLSGLRLPQPALLVTVMRGDNVWVPVGSTQLEPGDRVTAVTTVANEAALHDALAPGNGHLDD